MSADNYLAVMKYRGKWYVFQWFDSSEDPQRPPERAEEFNTQAGALKYAAKEEREDYYEYGIRII